jgi:hypothetical protein
MGGVTRTIRKAVKNPVKAVKETVGAAANVVSQVPVVKEVVKPIVSPGRPDTFAGAPKEVISAAADQVKETLTKTAGTPLGATTPKSPTAAGAAGSTSSATYNMRRRRGRGIATGSRGLTTSAPVQRKTLLGG